MGLKAFVLTSPLAPKQTRRQIGGRNAQKVGKALEQAIMASAEYHKAIVTLEELPKLGAKRVGGGKLIPTKICVDFIGCFNELQTQHDLVVPPAIPFVFDAKVCSEYDSSFDVRGRVPEHQLAFLRRFNRAGAISGFLIEWKKTQRFYWLDVADVIDDSPIRFQRDGVMCRAFVDCGPTSLLVEFARIRSAYL